MRYGARGVETQGLNTFCNLLPSEQRSVTVETVICKQTFCCGLVRTFFTLHFPKYNRLKLKDEAFKDLYLHKTFLFFMRWKKNAFKVVTCILGTPHNPTVTHPQRTQETRISVSKWGTAFYRVWYWPHQRTGRRSYNEIFTLWLNDWPSRFALRIPWRVAQNRGSIQWRFSVFLFKVLSLLLRLVQG